VVLAGMGALRVGAGKLQMATSESVARAVAAAVPEALVRGLAEDENGAVAAQAGDVVRELAAKAQAVVIGPGMQQPEAVLHLLKELASAVGDDPRPPVFVVDAGALLSLTLSGAVRDLAPLLATAVLTPNPGEAASMLGVDVTEVEGDPLGAARAICGKWGAIVAMKGPTTYTIGRDGRSFADSAGNVGLGTSGSGDVLAGAIGGLVARGADPVQATVWGVHVHARAGDALARRVGPLGYLARELPHEIPALMRSLAG
jgi:hydroxyethylthiazole kinase-like uncharacterized protein yjeF